MSNISENIKQICKENGYKQEYIAKKLGVTQGTLAGKLSNDNNIKYSLILEISNITKIPIIDIIAYPEKYVLKIDQCSQCKEKDDIVRNLNNYIKILETKIKRE